MLSREERILGEILVSRGLVERAAVESCARARLAGSDAPSLADLIVASGAADGASIAAAQVEARALDDALAPNLPRSGKLGEFRPIREIGRGGMGIVYEAEQEPLGRRVALKVLPALAALDERRALRFLREAKAAARLYHPGIVPVHASGISDGVLYFAMELIDGENVAEALARGAIPPRKAASIAAEVAHALAYAHAAGLVHRDVKPENILLGRDGRARVADFGLVQESVSEPLTLSHHLIGTPAYLAPEQALRRDVDARADIYSLGAVLYTMLCGEPPYRGEIPSAVLAQLLSEDPPALRARSPQVPRMLAEICARAMARDPDERYPTADALAAALESFVAAAGTDAPGAAPAPRRRSGMRPFFSWTLLAGLAVTGVVTAFVVSRWRARDVSATAPSALASILPMKGEECCSEAGAERCKRLDFDLSTGVDDSAASPGPIPVGGMDDDWWVTADPNGAPLPSHPVVVVPHSRWKDMPGSRWVSPNVFGRNGRYVYETCFCVRPAVRDPILDLAFLGDDYVTAVRFNDRSFPVPPPTASERCSYEADPPCRRLTTDPVWFVSGRNCLVIEVLNVGGSPNGLEVSASVRGAYGE